jgi:brefeldin A-inhibited guanine nucleotide-exchange protein
LQENDTLARIGTSCLQQLLEKNVNQLSSARWEQVTTTFVRLFRTTTPYQLFDESLRIEIDASADATEAETGNRFNPSQLSLPDTLLDTNGVSLLPAPLSPPIDQHKPNARTTLSDRRRIFKQIIVKCVLQLLLIETSNDLLRNNDIYNTIPPGQLLRMMGVFDQSYQFARSFNEDKELRTGLWKVGTSIKYVSDAHGSAAHRIYETPA